MAKYRFSNLEKYVMWEIHDKKCFWTEEPIPLNQVTVDHIIPESFLDKPEELEKIRKDYNLGMDFEINDYCNWVPCFGRVNSQKSTTLYQNAPAFLFVMEKVKKKAILASRLELKILKENKAAEILAKVGIEIEKNPAVELALVEQLELRKIPSDIKIYKPKGWYIQSIDPSNNEVRVTNGSVSGSVPTSLHNLHSFQCPRCHSYGPWNGVICLSCGSRSDGD